MTPTNPIAETNIKPTVTASLSIQLLIGSVVPMGSIVPRSAGIAKTINDASDSALMVKGIHQLLK